MQELGMAWSWYKGAILYNNEQAYTYYDSHWLLFQMGGGFSSDTQHGSRCSSVSCRSDLSTGIPTGSPFAIS